MPIMTADEQIDAFVSHLEEMKAVFDGRAQEIGLGLTLDIQDLVRNTRAHRNFASVKSFNSSERPGVLYREQLVTAVDATRELIESRYNMGLILGALQSGKTTTALALQFAGPASHLITGEKLFPFYLTTNQNSHMEQIHTELSHFIGYYGGIDVRFDGRSCNLRNYLQGAQIDPVFVRSPNLNTYRQVVLQGSGPHNDIYRPATIDDLIHKRARGRAIKELAASCQKMVREGFTPLMIVDEPQFGASDRVSKTGGAVAECLLSQIYTQIRAAIGVDADHMKAVGLSATPFELHSLQRVWTVQQRLGQGYRGFNQFGGQMIDSSVSIQPPQLLSLTDAARQFNIPFLPNVNPGAYSRELTFDRWALSNRYTKTWQDYRADCVLAVRQLIVSLVPPGNSRNGSVGAITDPPSASASASSAPLPIGICLRAMNDNDRTEQFLADLQLPANAIEVVRFFGSAGKGMSVKQLIAQRKKPHLPYLFMVTSKARMGDQFPSDVRYFLDFTQKSSDLNSLLQGLVGRACGYNKRSLVVLSDHNHQILKAYVSSDGDYVMKPSRHSVVVGGVSGIDVRNQITIDRDPADPKLEAFFQELDRRVSRPMVPTSAKLAPVRAAKGGRRGPVLGIAVKHGLFNHVESSAYLRSKRPDVFGTISILRDQQTATLTDKNGTVVQAKYLSDGLGNCRYNFRRDGYAGRAGIKGRGRGQRDSSNLTLNSGILEPSIGMRKRDAQTGGWIDNAAKPGEWVAVSITMPLSAPGLFGQTATAGRVSLPGRHCVFERHMTKREHALRGGRA